MSRRNWFATPTVARNPFRQLPPSQAVLARARKAGVDSSNGAAVEEWRRLGEPESVS
jgi:hypothetical protein